MKNFYCRLINEKKVRTDGMLGDCLGILVRRYVCLCLAFVMIVGLAASCGDDTEYSEPLDLDINCNVPRAYSSFEISTSSSYREIPVKDSACMMYAIMNMAVTYNIPVNGRSISDTYSAKMAYEDVEKYAIENKLYTEGRSMTTTQTIEIGKAFGILEGCTLFFSTEEELSTFLKSDQWKVINPSGRCIIQCGSDSHGGVFNGITKKGDIRILDSNGGKKYNDSYNTFYVIY